MTVSANTAFELNRDTLIRRAMQLAGILEASQQPSADDIALAADLLGVELLALQAENIVITQVERATASLTGGTAEYTLPTDTVDLALSPMNVIGTVYVTAGSETPVAAISRNEYQAITTKTTTGTPTLAFVERGFAVKAVFWPIPAVNMTFRYSRIRLPRDMDVGTVTLDLARRWQKPVIYVLAHSIAMAKNAPLSRVKLLLDEAERLKRIALYSDVEKGHMQMVIH